MENSDLFHFLKKAEKVGFDPDHRRKINFNISKYDTAVKSGKTRLFKNLELARKRAGFLKYKVVGELDKYLIEFESNFTRRGGKVIWAQDAAEAVKEIIRIAEKHKAGKVVK